MNQKYFRAIAGAATGVALVFSLGIPAQAQDGIIKPPNKSVVFSDNLALEDATIENHLRGLRENLVEASKTDAAASKSLGIFDSLSAEQQREMAVDMLTTSPFEETAIKKVAVSAEQPVKAMGKSATVAAASTASRQPVACQYETSYFGVKVSNVKMRSAVWAKNFGATITKVEKPNLLVVENMEPYVTITSGAPTSWISKNKAYFEINVHATRDVRGAKSTKGGTLRMVTTSSGVLTPVPKNIKEGCKWLG